MSELDKLPQGVAVKFGADYIKGHIFSWFDNAIHLDSSFTIRDPKSEQDLNYFEGTIIDLMGKNREAGVKLAGRPMPVYISNASAVDDKTGLVTLPFFKNGGLAGSNNKPHFYEAKSLSKKLSERGINPNELDLYIHNDGKEQLRCAVRQFKQEAKLEAGDLVYHFISGQGFGGVSARLDQELEVKEFSNKEPGHQEMLLAQEYESVEGSERQEVIDAYAVQHKLRITKGCAEPYVAGGNDKNRQAGPKATIYYLRGLNDEKLTEAIQKLSLTAFDNKERLSASDFKNSSLSQADGITTKSIGDAAQSGDVFAQAILIFTASRVADVMINTLSTENRFNQDQKPKLISYSGGLAKAFFQECPLAWRKLEDRLQVKFGKQVLLKFIEPRRNMDGTIEALEAKFQEWSRS